MSARSDERNALSALIRSRLDEGADPATVVSDLTRLVEVETAREMALRGSQEFVDLDSIVDDDALLKSRPSLYYRSGVVAVGSENGRLVLAASAQPDDDLFHQIDRLYGAVARVAIAPRSALDALWQRRRSYLETALACWMEHSPTCGDPSGTPRRWVSPPAGGTGEAGDEECSVSARFVNDLITTAVHAGYEQIILIPRADRVQIRNRGSGIVRDWFDLPREHAEVVIERIKSMSCFDLGVTESPQDGRVKLRVVGGSGVGQAVDVHLSLVPTTWGERLSLSISEPRTYVCSLESLAMQDHSAETLRRAVSTPGQITVIAGPARSGRVRTLYAALLSMETRSRDILVAEEKIQADLPGITQAVCRPGLGLSVQELLRSFLRQHADVVAGPIRCYEAIEVMMKAAGQGTTVVALLDAPSAVDAAFRLTDMGIEPRELAEHVGLLHAQRLLSRPCPNCRRMRPLGIDERRRANLDNGVIERLVGVKTGKPPEMAEAVGCASCQHSGYRGFSLVTDQILLTGDVKDAVAAASDSREVRKISARFTSPSFNDTGASQLLNGEITLESFLAL